MDNLNTDNARVKEKNPLFYGLNKKRFAVGVACATGALLIPLLGFIGLYADDPRGNYGGGDYFSYQVTFAFISLPLALCAICLIFDASEALKSKRLATVIAVLIALALSVPYAEVCHTIAKEVFLPAYKKTDAYASWLEAKTLESTEKAYSSYIESNNVVAEYKLTCGDDEMLVAIDKTGKGAVRTKTPLPDSEKASEYAFVHLSASRHDTQNGTVIPKEDVDNGYLYALPLRVAGDATVTLWRYNTSLIGSDAVKGDSALLTRCIIQIDTKNGETYFFYSQDEDIFLKLIR